MHLIAISLCAAIFHFSILVSSRRSDVSLIHHFKTHEGLLADKWEQYVYIYNRELKQYQERSNSVSLLEIGVSYGGSLQIWKSYFGPDSVVVGVDIDTRVCSGANFETGISVYCFDASDKILLTNFFQDKYFDIMIDDASHVSSDIIKTFEIGFQVLNPSGVYVVEDIVCSYVAKYEGGLFYANSTIEYFKKIIDIVNVNYAYARNSLNEMQLFLADWVESVKFEDGIV